MNRDRKAAKELSCKKWFTLVEIDTRGSTRRQPSVLSHASLGCCRPEQAAVEIEVVGKPTKTQINRLNSLYESAHSAVTGIRKLIRSKEEWIRMFGTTESWEERDRRMTHGHGITGVAQDIPDASSELRIPRS
jgi:hypothetical protein